MEGPKTFRPYSPRQSFLLAPSPLDWLPEGHLAYFVLDLLDELDLEAIESVIQAKDARGTRPFSPRLMTGILLYGYCVGVYSSRRIERATYEDVAFRVLAGGSHPHFTSIALFRQTHLKALEGLFVQVLRLCREAGLVKLGQVAIDGTKIQANASKHKAMSYERMEQVEARLEEEIRELLDRAEQADREEDERYGVGQREEDLPEELRRREQRLERIRQAKAALEERARENRARALRRQAEAARERAREAQGPSQKKREERRAQKRDAAAEELESDQEPNPVATAEGLPMREVLARPDGRPKANAQYNFTDPDSCLMSSSGTYVQGFNCQVAVDAAHQIVLAQAVTNQPSDTGNLLPMLRLVRDSCGAGIEAATADAGFWNAQVSQQCAEELGFEPLIALERKKSWERNPTLTHGPPPDNASARERMIWRLRTRKGRELYAHRKSTVEPVFGQAKEARRFRRFHLRGLTGASGEWALVNTAHNLLKLYRASCLAV